MHGSVSVVSLIHCLKTFNILQEINLRNYFHIYYRSQPVEGANAHAMNTVLVSEEYLL